MSDIDEMKIEAEMEEDLSEDNETQTYADAPAHVYEHFNNEVPISVIAGNCDVELHKHFIRKYINENGEIAIHSDYGGNLVIKSINDDFSRCTVDGTLLKGSQTVGYIQIEMIEKWITENSARSIIRTDHPPRARSVMGEGSISLTPSYLDVNFTPPAIIKTTQEILLVSSTLRAKIKALLNYLKDDSRVVYGYGSTTIVADNVAFKVELNADDIKMDDNDEPAFIPVTVHAYKELDWQGQQNRYITGIYQHNNHEYHNYYLVGFDSVERKPFDEFFSEYNEQQKLLKQLKLV